MPVLRLLLLVVLTPVVLLARLFGFGRRNVVVLPDDHPEMANAIERARATLPEFRRLVASPEPGMTNFGVKVRFPAEGGGHEHCWVNELELQGSTLAGKLGNHPNSLPGMHLGSDVSVRDDAITDWSYAKQGVYQGHFTTKVLLTHMPKRLRREVEAVYGWAKAS
jgi:uncharacterized protein YegJ (DUF2314 family)